MDWTPDEIVLTIHTYHQMKGASASVRAGILANLATLLGRTGSSVQAAIDAVGNPLIRSQMCKVLVSGNGGLLLSDASYAKQEADKIRKHWLRRCQAAAAIPQE